METPLDDNRQPDYRRISETCARYKISRSTLWFWVKNRADFPKPYKAGPKVTLFDINEIDAFLKSNNAGGTNV